MGHIELTSTGAATARLVRVLIAPEQRGRGLGGELVAAAIDRAREAGVGILTLNVVEDNAGAIRIYERLGFEHTGVLPERDSVLTMALRL